MRRVIVLVVYNLLLPFVFIVGFPSWLIKMFKRGGFGTGLLERFACFKEELDFEPSGVVYVHAVSVGEVLIAQKLIKTWQQAYPGDRFVLAPTTATGHAIAQTMRSEKVRVIYAPLDFRWILKKVFKRFEPKQIILIESEMWLNMLDVASRRGIPVSLANARLSARSERRYHKVKGVVKVMFGMLSRLAAQEPADRNRWTKLGVSEQGISVTGSIKFDQSGAVRPAKRVAFQQMIDGFGIGRPVVMALSTHSGEEALIAEEIRKLGGDCLPVIVPRHAERRMEVVKDLEGLGMEVILRSDYKLPKKPANACLLVDSTGELRDWTAHANVAVIGKSFIARGGQNPAEAIAAKVVVVTGPHMANFEPLVSMLRSVEGIFTAPSSEELSEAIGLALFAVVGDPNMLDRAEGVLQSHQGATLCTVEWLRVA